MIPYFGQHFRKRRKQESNLNYWFRRRTLQGSDERSVFLDGPRRRDLHLHFHLQKIWVAEASEKELGCGQKELRVGFVNSGHVHTFNNNRL
ncbi:hypothetical protein NPIL_542891 [Nephila pilipes]|uniref:Uncharacterized protein n=1 Tax=Nephila pilipes TaxID=299642 RepID=A0A8X6IIA7_NEPPI|nr:hypothetical protein NPIL_542891 [Nephila pilipes]